MIIRNRHLNHGAALTQIAEHELFTAINKLDRPDGGTLPRGTFRINDDIAIYVKHASEPISHDDYVFTFTQSQKEGLQYLNNTYTGKVFIVLVCVEDREICCISYNELNAWFEKRRAALSEGDEADSTVLVQLPSGQGFRVNMNMPDTRGQYLDEPQIVPRNRFPAVIFE